MADEPTAELDDRDYRRLSEFRYLIRQFLEFSETAAVRTGLTTRQHQALLAIKGVREGATPTIGYLAERLRIQHHSAVELVDRLVEAGLIVREQDALDRRRVRLELTPSAERRLADLSTSHLIELQRMQPALGIVFGHKPVQSPAMQERPLGPEVDPTPRALPARVPIRGNNVILEPLHRRHAPELWRAAQAPGAAASWDYLGYGPFASEAALAAHVAEFSSQHDPMAWAVRPIAAGVATGWLTLMDIQPKNAAIEIGHIWFAPPMQRTRAATEALFLLMRLAMDELGYRRLVWKCHAMNAPSRRAAERLGFTYEGTLRAHMVVKGRLRPTAYFSILDDEWPRCHDALLQWLDAANFAPDGTSRRGLAEIRASLAAT